MTKGPAQANNCSSIIVTDVLPLSIDTEWFRYERPFHLTCPTIATLLTATHRQKLRDRSLARTMKRCAQHEHVGERSGTETEKDDPAQIRGPVARIFHENDNATDDKEQCPDFQRPQKEWAVGLWVQSHDLPHRQPFLSGQQSSHLKARPHRVSCNVTGSNGVKSEWILRSES